MSVLSIKSISWLYQINYGGIETRAHNMARFLSRFADLEFLFAKTIFPETGYQRFFPRRAKNRAHKIAAFLSRFADIEFLLKRAIYSNASYQSQDNFRYTPIQIYFNPYKVYKKRYWQEFFIKKTTKYLERKKNKMDLVHAQGICGAVGINIGVPTITTIRGVDRWGKNLPVLEKLVVKKSNKLIAVTNRNRSLLLKRGVETEKISVIYSGVDFQGISDTTLKSKDFMLKYDVNPDNQIILSVHNFHRLKNTKRIVDSFINIKRKYPEYQLVLIGDGPERSYYISYVKKKGIEDVYFIGKLFGKTLYQFYKSADIFILPSLRETWGIVFLEAMAAKCAVVMTKNTSMTEIIQPEKHAILVDPYNESEIDTALISLMENSNRKEYIKQNGYKLASKLSWENQGKLLWEEVQKISR